MVGKYDIVVESKDYQIKCTVERNITIISGSSGSGKTLLIEMIKRSIHPEFGITVKCSVPCLVLEESFLPDAWLTNLKLASNSIIFIDEGNSFVTSKKFAEAIKGSDNYYVIVTREPLKQLPYSVDAIYEIRESKRYSSTVKKYKETHRIYSEKRNYSSSIAIKPNIIITEDSNSGYDFFSEVAKLIGATCISAHGKSNITSLLRGMSDESEILIIVDGAAFGCEIKELLDIIRSGRKIFLFAPESFEYLILRSGIIQGVKNEFLESTYDFADSKSYFSWEQYFTDLLVKITDNTIYKYSKRRLNKYYLSKRGIMKVLNTMPFLSISSRFKDENTKDR